MCNIDTETGIRYGVISMNEVLQAWADSSEPIYEYYCPHCGALLKKGCEARRCESCHKNINPDVDFDCLDPVAWAVDDGEYKAESFADDPDIFIIKSPYYTFCKLCSPCAPNAGYLKSFFVPMGRVREQLVLVKIISPSSYAEAFRSHAKAQGFYRAYCFSHDWFDEGKAPYTIFTVEGDLVVSP